MIRRVLLSLAAVVSVLAVTACTGLPVSGPVTAGRPIDEAQAGPEVRLFPDEAQLGASPEEIVDGFLRAGSGTSGDWATARTFLTPALAQTWNPSAGVTIVPVGSAVEQDVVGDTVTVSLSPRASVDESGRYDPSDGGITTLAFELVEIDGQWRIAQAPDGIVLDDSVFTTVFHRYSVMYFDPTWSYLVPDVRWYPTTFAAVRIAGALVDEPITDWLQGAVSTAFPDDVTFAWSSVPISAGTAQVELSREVLALDALQLDRMVTQLDASLATAGISDVLLTVDGTPLDATPVPTRSTAVTAAPLVSTEAGFGFLSGTQITPIPGLSSAVEQLDARAIQVSPDRDVAGVLTTEGSVVRADATGQVATLDTRSDLLAPAVDPLGYIWSVPRTVPAALTAFGRDLQSPVLAQAWATAGATEVAAIAISRDGTRMAGIVTVGSRREVWLSGVIRDGDGVPARLGDPIVAGVLAGPATALTWVDDTTVGIVVQAGAQTQIVEQPVGGAPAVVQGPAAADVTGIATASSSVRLRSDAGGLYVRRGANWLLTSEGIEVLAVQQGSPQ